MFDADPGYGDDDYGDQGYYGQDGYGPYGGYDPEDTYDGPLDDGGRGRRVFSMLLGGVAALALAGGGFLAYRVLTGGPDVTVADVTAVDQGSVRASLTQEEPPPASAGTDTSALDTTETSVASQSVDTDPNLLWVDPVNGNEANDGQTRATAWSSLQEAVDRLQPGQTLHLMSGRYTDVTKSDGFAHFLILEGGTEDAWITIKAAPGESPIVVATEGNAFGIKAPYVEIADLEIVGEGFSAENPYGWGVHVGQTHHVRIQGNRISQMPVGGVTTVDASNVEILYNEVFENSFWGTEQGSGISIWHARDLGFGPAEDGYHDVIVGNVVYRNENKVFSRWWPGQNVITDGNGIIIDENDDTGYTGRILVANNLVFDNGGRGILVNESSRVDIVHNTTYQNGRTEDLAGGPTELAMARSAEVQFLNNVAWPRPGSQAINLKEAVGIVMGGNVFVTDRKPSAATELDLVVSTDPGFRLATVDPAAANFRPTSSSVLNGRAIPTSPHVPFDADLGPRPPSGGTVGAYEIVPQ
ncbi:MAG: right-handed parallel beta-helix repeat-containing protein [Actinomycetota bacterium]